jgi:phage tail sheath protein FI
MGNGGMHTPGIFIHEDTGFGSSVVPVPTGEPAFIGYTRKAESEQGSLTGIAAPVASIGEFEALFGPSSGDGYGLFQALTSFYANGGGRAWIVSAGPPGAPAKADFLGALAALDARPEPAILLAPDALRLPAEDYYEVARAMVAHCASLGSRMTILDLHGGDGPEARAPDGLRASLAAFRAGLVDVPQDQRSFAAAYHPWLVSDEGLVPPSAAIAGIWTMTDNSFGVSKAPANVSVSGAQDVAISIDGATQEGMNAPLDGLAVNAIRSFPGKGILVWGARTLDGNSADFRYIPVRRTSIMLSQSIRYAVSMYAFEPNDAHTWVSVKELITRFLTAQWQQGAISGQRPSDAFHVQCGLGETMTGEDVLAGRMLVTVLVALLRPAEFVVLTFAQDMQGS